MPVQNLNRKRFLVTGGAGFIGSHVVDALLARGGKVAVIDNLSTGRRENVNPGAAFYEMNIADWEKLDAVFREHRPDYVYHFAYHVIVPKSIEDPTLDMDSIRGSLNVLRAAKTYQTKKIILSSSGFIYGNNPRLPLKEDEPHDPCSPYAISKYAVEGYLRFYKKNFGVDCAILRHAAVYGPRQVTGAMAAYVRDLRDGKPSEFYGVKTRDYVYIDDVVDANLRVLEIPPSHPNPVWNIGTGRETDLVDLYHMLARFLKKQPQVVRLPDRPGEQNRYCVDVAKARKELGWEPHMGLEDGVKATLTYWKLI